MRLDGVVVPMVTPMQLDGSIDLEACEPLLRWFAASGIGTVMLAGTSGEGHALDFVDLGRLTASVGPAWRDLTGGAGRLLVTISAPSTRAAVERARAVEASLPDALVVSAPYYFRYTDEELRAHYDALGMIGIPILAYDTPRYTGNPFSADLVDALALMPHVIGIKMSAGDMALVEHAHRREAVGSAFVVAQGDEDRLVDALRLGVNTIIPGVANVLPGLCVRLFREAMAGEWDSAERAQDGLRRMAAIHRIRRGVVATKTAMHLLGRCPPYASAPFLPYDDHELAALRSLLEDLSDLTDAEVA